MLSNSRIRTAAGARACERVLEALAIVRKIIDMARVRRKLVLSAPKVSSLISESSVPEVQQLTG
jgi:hypothetical protein